MYSVLYNINVYSPIRICILYLLSVWLCIGKLDNFTKTARLVVTKESIIILYSPFLQTQPEYGGLQIMSNIGTGNIYFWSLNMTLLCAMRTT